MLENVKDFDLNVEDIMSLSGAMFGAGSSTVGFGLDGLDNFFQSLLVHLRLLSGFQLRSWPQPFSATNSKRSRKNLTALLEQYTHPPSNMMGCYLSFRRLSLRLQGGAPCFLLDSPTEFPRKSDG